MYPLEKDRQVIDTARALSQGRSEQEETEAKRRAAEKNRKPKLDYCWATTEDRDGIRKAREET